MMIPAPNPTTITSQTAAMEANIATLAVFMSMHQIASCAIEYTGSGDSGETEEQTFAPVSGDEVAPDALTKPIPYVCYASTYFADKPSTVNISELSVEDFLSRLLDQVISVSGHSGWENNDGGGGTLNVQSDGKWTLEHYDNVVHQEYDNTEGSVEERTKALLSVVNGEREANRLRIEGSLQPITDSALTPCI